MRIACTNYARHLVGGTESYLKRLIPELAALGHTVSFWHEAAVEPGRAAIDAPELFQVGPQSPALLKAWKPDLIYNNGLMSMDWEAALPAIAPVVHYAHNYYGTCISGEKTRKFPTPRPCDRCFGPACLAQYLPRRCGGLSPFTMWHDYQLQSQRFQHLGNCSAIVTASAHIEAEYRRNGFAPVYRAPLFVDPPAPRTAANPDRILFGGRMMRLKGGELLIDAIPEVERLMGRPIEAIFAGDGPERSALEARKSKAIFTGWISQQAMRDLNAAVLVMPSLWPEPFGLAALELGLPAVAFRVGGIPDWLRDGVNGHLAESLTSAALARAIAACLQDPAHLRDLRAGAVAVAAEFSLKRHLDALLPVFESVLPQ
jgi:glycosyltransferase involved in cell wall biosynthesis